MAKDISGIQQVPAGQPSGGGMAGDVDTGNNPARTEDYTGISNRAENTDFETNELNQDDFITRTTGGPAIGEITKLDRASLLELASHQSATCVSIYMRTQLPGTDVNDNNDQLNFKQVLQELASRLEEQQTGGLDLKTLLQPAFQLNQDDRFWKSLTPGIAVFLADGFFRFVKLPVEPIDDVTCGRSFYIAPLTEVLSQNENFYLLTISKHNIRLFSGDRFGLAQVPLTGLPTGVEEITDTAQQNSSVFRTGGRGGTGGANFHGIGGELDHKQEIASYLEMVDDIIYKTILHDKNAPLLLAGVEYLIPIYRSVTDYKHLFDEALTGNHDNTDPETLRAEAVSVLQPFFLRRGKKAVESYRNSINTPLVSSMPETVIAAAYYGRVATLFVRKGFHQWGIFDEANNVFEWHDQQTPQSQDLVADAVRQAILNGGDVFYQAEVDMPWKDADIAAILRY